MEPIEEITPPVDLLTPESLPFDVQKQIALNLQPKTFISFCRTSKKLKRVCDDIYFLKEYFRIHIPIKIDIPEGATFKWYRKKIFEYPAVKKLTDIIELKKARVKYIGDPDKKWNIFEIVENIKEISLYRTKLTIFPFMYNLETLVCIECKVMYLPTLPNLQVLNRANNPITRPKLDVEDLYRMNNLLTSIPPLPNL